MGIAGLEFPGPLWSGPPDDDAASRRTEEIKAVVIDPAAPARVTLGEVAEPRPAPGEALVRVKAFSMNRGEIKFAANREPGSQIGWDAAGIVEEPANDGTGPKRGARVVGFSKAQRGWAEVVAIPTNALAELPESVSEEVASTLPVAGLTALYTLERGRDLLGNRVLVTGATGGVGGFAVQLGALMGARVVGQVRRAEQVEEVTVLGAAEVLVDPDGSVCGESGPYQLIVDAVGGDFATRAIRGLGPRGTAVLYGLAAGMEIEISIMQFLGSNFSRIEGFSLLKEDAIKPVSDGLERLMRLVAEGRVESIVNLTETWSKVGEVARGLMEREFTGKAVLRVE